MGLDQRIMGAVRVLRPGFTADIYICAAMIRCVEHEDGKRIAHFRKEFPIEWELLETEYWNTPVTTPVQPPAPEPESEPPAPEREPGSTAATPITLNAAGRARVEELVSYESRGKLEIMAKKIGVKGSTSAPNKTWIAERIVEMETAGA